MLNKIKNEGVVAVIRAKDHEEALGYINACLNGGVKAIELTYTIPNVVELIKHVSENYADALVGVGSVLNGKMAKDAIEAGAAYVVSPGFSDEVNTVCQEMNTLYLPGCMTVTEVMNALEKGNKMVKLFPGEVFGPKYVKAVKAPIPHVEIMPTGGVSIDNIEEWFKMGVSCVGVGSSLLGAGSLEDIENLAKEFKTKLHKSEDNRRSKVLGFGEIMLRLTPTNFQRVIQAESFEATYAGGEANVICSLSMFGHDTKMLTKLPQNVLGDKVIRAMNSFGVDTKDIVRGKGRLGIYFLEQGHGVRNSDVTYDREYSAISMASLEDFDFDKILEDVKLVHLSGVTPALSSNLYEISLELVKVAKSKGILVSYDSNYRSKLWTLEQARSFMLEVLPYVDIAFLGILDFINILEYQVSAEKNYEAKLADLYRELFEKYPNLKYAASTKRTVNSVNNNSLQGYFFDGEILHSSRIHTFDILDRVGGGDSFTAGILHGVLSEMNTSQISEFATCASALKHSIRGDINMVDLHQVHTLMDCGIENINR